MLKYVGNISVKQYLMLLMIRKLYTFQDLKCVTPIIHVASGGCSIQVRLQVN